MDSFHTKFEVRTYLLREFLSSDKATLDELTGARMVAIEVPPTTMASVDRLVSYFVRKVISLGAHVFLLTLPRNEKHLRTALAPRMEQERTYTLRA